MTTNTKPEFEYKSFIQKKLKPHPIGRTTSDLQTALPDTADQDILQETLEKMSEKGKVQQIGETWRWMEY